MANDSKNKNSDSRNKMYRRKPEDREFIREGDVTSEESADPVNTDGYGGPSTVTAKLRKKGAPYAPK